MAKKLDMLFDPDTYSRLANGESIPCIAKAVGKPSIEFIMNIYSDAVWDFEEAVAYIRTHTNIDEAYIRVVLRAEEDYMKSIGLIEEN